MLIFYVLYYAVKNMIMLIFYVLCYAVKNIKG